MYFLSTCDSLTDMEKGDHLHAQVYMSVSFHNLGPQCCIIPIEGTWSFPHTVIWDIEIVLATWLLIINPTKEKNQTNKTVEGKDLWRVPEYLQIILL